MDKDKKIISTLRGLSVDMINQAKSGHPGICLGAAPIIYTLFSKHLVFNPNDGEWLNRDKFVLSAGHGSALLYSTLFLAGYPISLEDIRNFRKINSPLTGHPELNRKLGIEVTTGPLGEGFATSVGLAIGEEYLKNNISKEIFNNYTYVLVGDGDLMEGISYEAASLAGSLKLGHLIVLYDSNNISLDGSTTNVFNDNVLKRFESSGWHTEYVSNAEDITSIDKAIQKSKAVLDKPSIIQIKSTIGFGSVNSGTNKVHGKPLDEKDIINLKTKLGLHNIPFHVSKEAAEEFRKNINDRNLPIYNAWVNKYNEILNKKDPISKNLIFLEKGSFKINLKGISINFAKDKTEELRVTNEKLMNIISDVTPLFLGGSADVSSSTKVFLRNGKDFKLSTSYGKNIHFGVRENLMASILNGLALLNLRAFGSTFLTFSDYMRPGIRLSSMMNLPVTYIFTHDSILIGEDGPTHQPIEQLGSLRNIPNIKVFRPADVRELLGSWDYIINNPSTSCLVVSKESLPQILTSDVEETEKGAYIISKEVSRLNGIIIATGTEVHTALKISNELSKKGIYIRVISMPCIEIFENQSNEYKQELFPIGAKVIALEASNDNIWNKFVYNQKYLLTLNTFGYSGSKEDVLEKMNFDFETLLKKVETLLK